MWVVNFVVMRDGERSRDDGSPRFLNSSVPFPVPDIDQSVVHRGEMFVVDDVVWDLERKAVFVEIVPAEEEEAVAPQSGVRRPTRLTDLGEIEIETEPESDEPESDEPESDEPESDEPEG